jgi:hypothetical protein
VLVPPADGTSGAQFDPLDVEAISGKLAWMAVQNEENRLAMGQRAYEIVSRWGPERFAQGALEALELATELRRRGSRKNSRMVKREA